MRWQSVVRNFDLSLLVFDYHFLIVGNRVAIGINLLIGETGIETELGCSVSIFFK